MLQSPRRGIVAVLVLVLLSGCVAWPTLPGLPAANTPTIPADTILPPTAIPTFTPNATPFPSTTTTPSVTPTAVPTLELPTPTPALAPLAAEERERIFEQVWNLVKQRYLYTDYRGLDWETIRTEYAPKAAAAEDPATFYAMVSEMIDRLGDNHSRFENPQEVANEAALTSGGLVYGGIGVSIRSDTNGALITQIGVGSPAEIAGLMIHDRILAINSIPITDTAAFGADGPEGAVRGPPGTQVQLTVQSVGQLPRKVVLTRQIIPGDAFPPVLAQRLPGHTVGLLRIDTFNREELVTLVRDQLDELLAEGPIEALIIDVRDNGGGYVAALLDTLGLFIDGGSIGSTAGRRDREELTIPTGMVVPGIENVPIAVLIDNGTASAAEMFAAGMRVRDRAMLVGETTAGNTENLVLHNFADGSRLWLAEYAYRLPDGALIEDTGVQPDRAIAAEWWRFDPINDPQVQAALDVLHQKH